MKRSWMSVFLVRSFIVGLALMIFAMVSGPFFAGLTKRALHESTGWTWNFDLVEVDFLAGRMVIEDLILIPPEGSRKEALIADKARVRVGSWGLWNRQLVFDSVDIEGVRSSSLDRLMVMNPQDIWPLGEAETPLPVPARAVQSGRVWLDSFSIGSPRLPVPESPELEKQILGEWESELAQQVALISEAETRIGKLRESMVQISDNPLRQGAQRAGTARQLEAVAVATTAARNSFQQLVERRNQDIQRLAQSRERDLRMINAASQKKEFSADEKLADDALIGAEYDRFSSQISGWACSIRDSVIADNRRIVNQPAEQGRKILFTGSHPQPRLTVHRMNLDGAAKMGAEHVDFVVSLENLTDRIQLQDGPTKLVVRAQGRYHLLVSGEFLGDMTGELKVTCPDFAVGKILMGHPDSISVVAPGGSVSFFATVRITEETVQGTAELEHRFSGLQPDSMHVLLRSQIDQQLLATELGMVSGFTSRIAFDRGNSQTLTQVESGPGRLFLAAVSRCLIQSGGAQVQELVEKIDKAKNEVEQQTATVIGICSNRLDALSAQTRELVAQAEASVKPGSTAGEIRR